MKKKQDVKEKEAGSMEEVQKEDSDSMEKIRKEDSDSMEVGKSVICKYCDALYTLCTFHQTLTPYMVASTCVGACT